MSLLIEDSEYTLIIKYQVRRARQHVAIKIREGTMVL